jgi:hypothetical protein
MYKLPKIKIKKFNGNLSEWLGFWSQFEKIHLDEELHDSDKFQYLVQSLIPGSRAYKLVTSYPQSAANYQKVISALTDRFGDKTLLTEVYVRQLIKLVMKNVGGANTKLVDMYDELESNLNALESLDVMQEHSAAFLYPLVESSLTEDVLKAWQRSTLSGYELDEDAIDKSANERLKQLMKFLRREVKGAKRLSYVREGLGISDKDKMKPPAREKKCSSDPDYSTASGLLAGSAKVRLCVFCEKAHDSQNCVSAQSMSYDVKFKKIKEKGACKLCLLPHHIAKTCRSIVKCIICGKRHVTLMCQDLSATRYASGDAKADTQVNEHIPEVHSKLSYSSNVILQTLMRVIRHNGNEKRVRALLDSGSQKSYILDKTAVELKLKSKGDVQLCHLLFGGLKQNSQHQQYEVVIVGRHNNHHKFSVLGHSHICDNIPVMEYGTWLTELKEKGIFVTDLVRPGDYSHDIELLIGADYYGQLLTGRIEHLSNGLVAIETRLGWTLSGALIDSQADQCLTVATEVTSMFVREADITELWNLETIGIKDHAQQCSKQAINDEVKEHFMKTVVRLEDGRYQVSLPWIDCPRQIPNNKSTAVKRLHNTTAKLQTANKYWNYDKVFKEWLAEGIIERVENVDDKKLCYFLPHRAVFKPQSLTTPVRPVFDASCKTGRAPCLNQCMEKGPNLLELIPSILLRFREKKIGVTADIRKAFQMIEIAESDRDFLMFLWWENGQSNTVCIYRHRRVVFGVNCSSFLLAAVIELHLKNVSESKMLTAEKLQKSLYVDNCVTSVNTFEEYEIFRQQSIEIMAEAKMDLRQWECSSLDVNLAVNERELTNITKVLGLLWNKERDVLSCEIPHFVEMEKVTKRTILSFFSQIYDPIGFTCPAVLLPKLLLQETWVAALGWEETLPTEIVSKFCSWAAEAHLLAHIEICRNIHGSNSDDGSGRQLHVFCDASQVAYATVIFMRSVDVSGVVSVQMVAAKARLSPIKKPTIPRMELLACTIAARLAASVSEALNLSSVQWFYWTDSTTALAWIKGNDEWGTFVGNRVKDICSLTDASSWRHVSGVHNPADLPSRGCSPSQLLTSRWWEGPDWLRDDETYWPSTNSVYNEEVINSERQLKLSKRTTICTDECIVATALSQSSESYWYLRSSNYMKNVRIFAWIKRFLTNSRCNMKTSGQLTVDQIKEAELMLFSLVQTTSFAKETNTQTINGLEVEKSIDGVFRVRTKLTHSEEAPDFRLPVLLPNKHPLVTSLIQWYHVKHCHAGTQLLMSKLRETVWILRARQEVNKVLHKCPNCLRHSQKGFIVNPAPLPTNRTTMGNVFQVTGVDLAGPLFLKNKDKVYITLFTCAVYRCIHLDLVMSLNTEAFMNALERFVSVRGRPSTIYSHNGTNFVGAVNLFKKLDWHKIEDHCGVRQIQWIFNPPSAAWWGGWWERLVRTVKDLLKRMLGNAKLSYDQLRTSLSHVESVVL